MQNMNSLTIFNKGFEYKDLKDIFESNIYRNLLKLVYDMTSLGLATTNRGTLKSTNLKDSSGRHLRHTLHYLRAWEYVRLISVPRLQLQKKAKILCLGEGSSPLMFNIAKIGHDVVVVDLEKELIDNSIVVARELKLPIITYVGDMTALEFEDNMFDYVVSCSVVEHLAERNKIAALSEMGRVLKSGGLICLSFDYGLFKGRPLTGEAHEAIRFNQFENLLIQPSKCKPMGEMRQEAEIPWVLKPRYWNWKIFKYYPSKYNLIKFSFYNKMPYSYYTLFLQKN